LYDTKEEKIKFRERGGGYEEEEVEEEVEEEEADVLMCPRRKE
jgi:hypothetical protein